MDKKPHILNTSASLLGISFVLITGLKVSHASEKTNLDEICVFAAIGFITSFMLSFFSMKFADTNLGRKAETISEYVFMASLISLFVAIIWFSIRMA